MFIFHYPPIEAYPHLGNPRRDQISVEALDDTSALAQSFKTVVDPIGTNASISMVYFPADFEGEHSLGETMNVYLYQVIGSCAVDGYTTSPGDMVAVTDDPIKVLRLPGSPCVFARLTFEHLNQQVQITKEPHELVKQILVDDYLSPEICQRFIGSLKDWDSNNRFGKVLTNATDNVTEQMFEYRKTEIMRSSDDAFVRSVLADIITSRVEPFFDTTIEFWNEPVLLKYDVGGFFVPHTDGEMYEPATDSWSRIYDRDYTLVAFLNEEYQGGELSFPDLNFVVTPKQGRVVAFPADHRFRHAAEQITAGTRFQLVSWLTAYGTARTNTPPNPTVIYRTW